MGGGGGHEYIIGCVGKPSAGKSTFFNAVTDAQSAKVGAYPFTTIEPNQGVCYYTATCPCVKYNVKCKPRYGSCKDGCRRVPLRLLDVAGLIPGASEGRGLGNKFLNDLCHADVLLHILDISGTTNEKGEATVGYDPSNDHDWLVTEVTLWVFNNLWSRWPSVARRHKATGSSLANTLLSQFSGYGARLPLVQKVIDEIKADESEDLTTWDRDKVMKLIGVFVKLRFRFILVLNKADSGGDVDRNTIKICEKYDPQNVHLCSALAECFLRKMKQQKYILYEEGSMCFFTADDPEGKDQGLKPLDEKLEARLEKLRDLVIFRHGSTGVQKAINRAVEISDLVPVYPVKTMTYFGGNRNKENCFPECLLVQPNTTVKEFASMLHHKIGENFNYAEGPDGRRLGEDELLSHDNNIVKYVTFKSVDDTSGGSGFS